MKIAYLSFFFCLFLAACTRAELPSTRVESCIVLRMGDYPATRATSPDEDLITDYNLLIFNELGVLEEKVYVPRRQMTLEGGRVYHFTRLLKDAPHIVFAAANLGYEIPCKTLREVLDYRYHLVYPDEFTPGMPMAAIMEKAVPGDDCVLEVPLERLMARIDLGIDRRALDPDVQITVREVLVGGCPSSILPFQSSKALSAEQIFLQGYLKTDAEAAPLNRDVTLGLSDVVSVYLLENRQGDLLEGITDEREKILSDSRYSEVCSFIELKADYHSPRWHTRAGEHLVYRFYLGESPGNFDVRRNTLYRIWVRPQGDGLQEDSWRVDKTALEAGPIAP